MGGLCALRLLCGSRASGKPRSGPESYHSTTHHLRLDPEPLHLDLPKQQLEHGFLAVRGRLSEADALFSQAETQLSRSWCKLRLMIQPQLRKSIEDMRKQLRQAREEYHNLAWLSREQAGEAQALATDFTQVCLPRLRNTKISLPVRVEELNDYEEMGSRLQESRQKFNERLALLIQKLRSIEGQLKVVACSRPRVMSSIKRILLELAVPVFKSPNVEVVSMHSLLQILSPSFASDIRGTRYFLETMASTTDPSILAPLRSSGIGGTLTAISLLSYVMHLDIRRLRDQLKNWTAQAPIETFVDLQNIEQIYSFLASALHQYQVAV